MDQTQELLSIGLILGGDGRVQRIAFARILLPGPDPDRTFAQFRYPSVAHHREEPTVEPGADLPAIRVLYGLFANRLNKIVCVGPIPRQCQAKPVKTR